MFVCVRARVCVCLLMKLLTFSHTQANTDTFPHAYANTHKHTPIYAYVLGLNNVVWRYHFAYLLRCIDNNKLILS